MTIELSYDPASDRRASDPIRMRRMLYGPLLSRALCAVAELGIPTLLAAGEATVAELAARTGSDASVLGTVLRSLTAFEVFSEPAPGRFALTSLGATLLPGSPGSALPTALLAAGEIGAAWNELATTVRTGQPAFDHVHGTDFFSYASAHRRFREIFDASQVAGMHLELGNLLRAMDFDAYHTIVDVGGGDGALVEAILDAYAGPRAVLFDLPSVVAAARKRLAGRPSAARIRCVAGDFDAGVPPDADLYLLRHIMHDWSDDRCVAILRRCRAAMIPGGRVMIVDRMAARTASGGEEAQITALMTLYMLTVVQGRERTREEFTTLLNRAGLVMDSVTPIAGDTVVLVASST
ncbi:methyltransferase [Nocardia transvalensis]|uniref:methyltransferase n=1 Tax=Nocardia transvalensis TaxID=37333 RepID=UPI00189419E1|nr:methyltransferase [Nocardia transvalensis]MBF6331071.1 methyltransferase [Nocardia transvalensis]